MARRTIRIKLPRYDKNKSGWRRAIHDCVMATKVEFGDARLEVAALVYLKKGKGVAIRDVDNLIKHILDALQGRFGATREANCLIDNDNRVYWSSQSLVDTCSLHSVSRLKLFGAHAS